MKTPTKTCERGSASRARPVRRLPPEVLGPVEVANLLRACEGTDQGAVRLRALVVVLYRSGMRISEALSLRPRDMDLSAGWIRIMHGKGGRSRVVGMDPRACAVVGEWLLARGTQDASVPVFCTQAGKAILTNFSPRAKKRDKIPSMPQQGEIDLLSTTHSPTVPRSRLWSYIAALDLDDGRNVATIFATPLALFSLIIAASAYLKTAKSAAAARDSADAAKNAAEHRSLVDVQAKLLSQLWTLRMQQRIYVELPEPDGSGVGKDVLASQKQRLIEAIRSAHAALYAFLMLPDGGRLPNGNPLSSCHQLAVDCYWLPQISSLDAIRKEWENGAQTPTDRKEWLRTHPAIVMYDEKVDELEKALCPKMSYVTYMAPLVPPDLGPEKAIVEKAETRKMKKELQDAFDKWVGEMARPYPRSKQGTVGKEQGLADVGDSTLPVKASFALPMPAASSSRVDCDPPPNPDPPTTRVPSAAGCGLETSDPEVVLTPSSVQLG